MSSRHFSLMLVLIVVWGLNFVLIKIGLSGFPPIFLVTMRFFLASIPAIFFVKRPNVSIKMIIYYGLLMFALQFALLFLGMAIGISASLASILLQVQIFFSLPLAAIILKEKINRWQILGALISFSGILYVAFNIEGHMTLVGFLLVLGAAAAWGPGNILSKKMGSINMFGLVIWSSLVAWPPLLALSFYVEGFDAICHSLIHIKWTSIIAIAYITYVSTLFGYGMWNWFLSKYPVSTILPFNLLVPISAMLSSSFFLKESIELWQILATFLVIGGLGLNLLGIKKKTISTS